MYVSLQFSDRYVFYWKIASKWASFINLKRLSYKTKVVFIAFTLKAITWSPLQINFMVFDTYLTMGVVQAKQWGANLRGGSCKSTWKNLVFYLRGLGA